MIEKVLLLSTAHIKQETSNFLHGVKDGQLPFRVVPHTYGFILFTAIEWNEEEFSRRVLPLELKNIVKYAIEKGCVLVDIDRDADEIQELKTFNW